MLDMHIDRLEGLQPAAREKGLTAFAKAEAEGVGVMVASALRTFKEQAELYAQGRTKPGKVVTNAQAGESYHNFGLAFDFVVVRRGRAIWDSKDPHWKRFVKFAKSAGFEWGGDWPNPDFPHFQIKNAPSLTSLRAKFPQGFGMSAGQAKAVPRDKLPLKFGHIDGTKKLISQLQLRLGIKVNGRFGKGTLAAVEKWQATHNEKGEVVEVGKGLEIDGKVGKDTWGSLFIAP